jgi:NADPH-dependent curcumin reductase CurA
MQREKSQAAKNARISSRVANFSGLLKFMGQLIMSRASIHGFLVFDWWHRPDEALRRLAEWQAAGKIHFKEDVLDGIERVPEAFLRLLHGKNFGKQIVRIN